MLRTFGIIEIALVKIKLIILTEALLKLNISMHKQLDTYIINKEVITKYYNSFNLVQGWKDSIYWLLGYISLKMGG